MTAALGDGIVVGGRCAAIRWVPITIASTSAQPQRSPILVSWFLSADTAPCRLSLARAGQPRL